MAQPLNYRIDCELDEAQSPPTVVLIHGLFGALENLGAIARALKSEYRVISVDLPSHGRSPWVAQEAMSLQAMAASVARLLDQLAVSSCALLGHSLGGKVAMELAMAEPGRVSKLIVADIAPVSYKRRHDGIFEALRTLPLATLTGRRQADSYLSDKVQELGVRQFLLKNLYKNEAGQYQWRMNLEGLYQSYEEFIAAPSAGCYRGPCLFIKGELSDYVLNEHRAQVLARFPLVQLKVMQGCGHWLHAQKPDTFIRLCQKFLGPL